jgi:hypothetical protein
LKLATASKQAVCGDFDGDGRLDLAFWDGATLKVATRAADGTFGAAKAAAKLPECASLDCIDVGAKAGSGLVVGTAGEPLLLTPDGAGGFTSKPLAGGAAKELLKDMGSGGCCAVADFDKNGICDVMQLFTGGVLVYTGQGPGQFKAPEKVGGGLAKNPCCAICGDFDNDGWLDVVTGGADGLALFCREGTQQYGNRTHITGELAYHGNANQPEIVGGTLSDVNGDGRQGVALFYPKRNLLLFFNRGFGCFGWARELDPSGAAATPGAEVVVDPLAPPKQKLKALEALQQGQAAGTALDLNGDGVQDLLAVDTAEQKVWAVLARRDDGQPARMLLLSLGAKATGPLTVTVRDKQRSTGMYVLRPGSPAFICRPQAGPVTLEWVGANGQAASRKAVVAKPGVTRLELTP